MNSVARRWNCLDVSRGRSLLLVQMAPIGSAICTAPGVELWASSPSDLCGITSTGPLNNGKLRTTSLSDLWWICCYCQSPLCHLVSTREHRIGTETSYDTKRASLNAGMGAPASSWFIRAWQARHGRDLHIFCFSNEQIVAHCEM